MKPGRRAALGRRDWLKLLPALTVVANAQTPAPEVPQKITKEMLQQALQLAGLTFTDAQMTMMLPGVNRQAASYDLLRKLEVPLDTEPALHFRPLLPGKEAPAERARFVPTKTPAILKWTSAEDLAFLPASQLGALVRAKRITSTELTKMYLQRLKTYGPKLNCVITLTEDLALEQAERASSEIKRGKYKGPLHGIPYGAKDLFATKGIKTTWGAEPYQEQVIDYNATVIDRLEKAGAILLAKLSMGALAQGGLWFGGMTKTPWDYEQTSSGSSAGSASATAAGLVGFSIGTETLGSIVSPSTRCGVTGLRPTYGRVSRYGAMGLSWTMDKIGPICRSAEDCAFVLHAIYGPDEHDRTVLDAPFDWDAHRSVSDLRIGLIQSDIDQTTGETRSALEAAVPALRTTGAKLTPIAFPANKSGAIRFVLLAEAAAAFDDITRDRRVETLKGQGPGDWPNTFRYSRLIPAVEYIRGQHARILLMQQVEKFMEDWDVLVGTPASTLVATNLTGHPQVVVPCGFAGGLPVSILFTGGLCKEGTALRLAHAFQTVTDWHEKQPKMDWA